jgi:hypothetical protein
MAVEQARKDGLSTNVDLLVAVEARPDLQDPSALDRDVGVGGLGSGAVEDPSSAENRSRHRILPARSLRGSIQSLD